MICTCAPPWSDGPNPHCEQHGDYWHRAGKNNNELDGKLSAVRGAPTPDRSKPGKEAQQ